MNDTEINSVGKKIEQTNAIFRAQGLTLEVHDDFSGFKKSYCGISGRDRINPIFNLEYSDLHSKNSFWVSLSHNEKTVGTAATRKFTTQNLRKDFAFGLFLRPRRPLVSGFCLDGMTDGIPPLNGRIVYQGGLYLADEARGNGIGLALGRVCRLLSIQFYDADWHMGDCRESIAKSRLPLVEYGYAQIKPCYNEQYLKDNNQDQLYIMWTSQMEMLRHVLEYGNDISNGPSKAQITVSGCIPSAK